MYDQLLGYGQNTTIGYLQNILSLMQSFCIQLDMTQSAMSAAGQQPSPFTYIQSQVIDASSSSNTTLFTIASSSTNDKMVLEQLIFDHILISISSYLWTVHSMNNSPTGNAVIRRWYAIRFVSRRHRSPSQHWLQTHFYFVTFLTTQHHRWTIQRYARIFIRCYLSIRMMATLFSSSLDQLFNCKLT